MYVYLQLTWSNLVIFGQGSMDLSEVASINIYVHKLFFFFIKKID